RNVEIAIEWIGLISLLPWGQRLVPSLIGLLEIPVLDKPIKIWPQLRLRRRSVRFGQSRVEIDQSSLVGRAQRHFVQEPPAPGWRRREECDQGFESQRIGDECG